MGISFCIHHLFIRRHRGVLTGGLRALGPQVRGTRVAAMVHVQRRDLACRSIYGDPPPLLVRFLLHTAGPCIGFHLTSLDPHIAGTADGLDEQMVRQYLEASTPQTQEPHACDPYGTTDAA
jgi:hypothetical protein